MAFIIENIHSPIAGGGHSLVVTRDSATRRLVLAKNGTPELHLDAAQTHELLKALHTEALILGFAQDDHQQIRKGRQGC